MSATVTDPSRPHTGAIVSCDLIASATSAVAFADVARLREPVLAAFPDRMSNALLKQADEQSIVALATFRELLGRHPEYRTEAAGWGLVAAPRVPGRRRMVESLVKFKEQGAWSVSPHIIPHCTLHSLSGLLSQVLELHGPNMGAGGRPGCEAEALTVAAAWLAAERLAGAWLVLTGWDRETPTHAGATCQAVVVALAPAQAANRGRYPRLTIAPSTNLGAGLPAFSLEGLRSAVESPGPAAWRLGDTGTLGLRPAARMLEVAA